MRRALSLTLAALFTAAAAHAQRAVPPDSLFRRAQRLASEGAGPAARALLDSLVRTSAEGSDARAEALFWRATLSPDSLAQDDYLTIVVDHALSPRAADALLRLGRLEFERGDREASRRHFERLVLEHADAPAAGDGWYWLGRTRLQENDLAGGCAALDSALAHLPASDVERLRPVLYYSQPCKNLAAAPAAPAARDTGSTVPPPVRRDATPARPHYSVQVAAYETRASAETLVKKLAARGYDARVDSLKLFHVRIGAFTTRARAAAIVTKLKQQGQTAIVVEVDRREP